MQLDIAGQAIIRNLNVRADHRGDECELAVDIKLVLQGDLDALANFSPALKTLLYLDADDERKRTLRMRYLKPLGFTFEFKDHIVRIADQSYGGVRLHKFEIAPHPDGQIEVAFTATMTQVDPDILPDLVRLWDGLPVDLSIGSAQGSLKLEAA